MKTYKGMITELQPNQIFVFGSNTEGRHGKGAALFAREKCGAIYGQAKGLQGRSYAIVTKDLTKDNNKPSISKSVIKIQIKNLYDIALRLPDTEFLIAYSGTGKNLNNYSNEEMADMFNFPVIPHNIVFEEEFAKLIRK